MSSVRASACSTYVRPPSSVNASSCAAVDPARDRGSRWPARRRRPADYGGSRHRHAGLQPTAQRLKAHHLPALGARDRRQLAVAIDPDRVADVVTAREAGGHRAERQILLHLKPVKQYVPPMEPPGFDMDHRPGVAPRPPRLARAVLAQQRFLELILAPGDSYPRIGPHRPAGRTPPLVLRAGHGGLARRAVGRTRLDRFLGLHRIRHRKDRAFIRMTSRFPAV